MRLPPLLDELLDWFAPDCLWIAATRHSESAYTLDIMDLDYTLMAYRASLSLDGRWTLTPIDGPYKGRPVSEEWSQN